jgi:predicted CopG family antitoxin
MAIRTISLKQEAYDRLRAARRYPTESFSEVILRAAWPEDTVSGRRLLALMRSTRPWFSDAELDVVEALKAGDVPPEDKWTDR